MSSEEGYKSGILQNLVQTQATVVFVARVISQWGPLYHKILPGFNFSGCFCTRKNAHFMSILHQSAINNLMTSLVCRQLLSGIVAVGSTD